MVAARLEAPKEINEQVEALAREKLGEPRASQVAAFLRQYYDRVDQDDLRERRVSDLYGSALSHWNFLQRFTGGQALVRVYNPRTEEHGWQSTHTVIEIVNDDMPFLVDSVTMEVNRQGLTLHLIIHPVMRIRRDEQGRPVEVLAPTAAEGRLESLMHVEVDRRSDPAALDAMRGGIERALQDVRRAVDDWRPMRERMRETADALSRSPPPVDPEEVAEARAFLDWALESHFTFLGFRDYELAEGPEGDELRLVPGSSLGILRGAPEETVSASFAQLPREIRALARVPEVLVLTKANTRATVHRTGYLDYIGVKRIDATGAVTGERRFLGLYTHIAYSANPAEIPVLRRKLKRVIERAGLLAGGHLAKDLQTLLETYPRDELFQIGDDDLFRTAMGILSLGERQRIRLFVRRDRFSRFVSCLVYVPREIYDTDLRRRFQRVLSEAFNGLSSEFTVQVSESVNARILITVRTRPEAIPGVDVSEVEARLVRVARRWRDDLHEALVERLGEERGNALYAAYGGAFPAGYREDTAAIAAVHDVELLDALGAGTPLRVHLYRPLEAAPEVLRFKVFQRASAVPLSTSLPMLEHMGVKVLDERPYKVVTDGRPPAFIHDFALAYEGDVDLAAVRGKFEEAFVRVWNREAESDDFNRLVPRAGLGWREVAILRACGKYLRQAGFALSQSYMEHALTANPAIARRLVDLFMARFDPARREGSAQATTRLAAEIEEALDAVANLDEDRILRRYLALVQAMLRTNYFQRGTGGNPKPYLSFKLDPSRIPGLPEPRPMFEIFVYSPRVEGVHLRGGKVARGGIRWSDRMEDFRTEVLGLMKAQMVKNAVIVPVGSKGGFVVKSPPSGGDREALMKEGIACYSTFLRGLLDLTDNLVGGKVAPPPEVVRHDADDPYLVVAADKGTASFSDIANGISGEYGFWLGDAFASGGSAGYDHKKMGITARGAWESVKRHFRELGLDIQATDFTVLGIGDMSGDVFGNGMLLSRHIRLVGAFDHRHVFLDPNPDPETSFRERERLFALPRSSWAEYDSKLISQGGGIWPRGAKSIPLSAEARQALGIDAESLSPADLVRAMLKAPVDLLYNGGIGTYVKASRESHAEVGDRSNDAVRVDGRELRCKVAVEGGNLGFTQLGRIEYALAGGRINTDAIDNSGGVDTSDHEVNIKILLDAVVAAGDLTGKQRNSFLAEMTDDVAALVLRDNYFQNQSLMVTGIMGTALLDAQARFIRFLERAGRLNRAIEFLPGDEEIAERAQQGVGLTSPERSVLLAYAKMWLYDQVTASDLPDDPYIATAMTRYFPGPLRERFAEPMRRHPLRREIIATHVINSMVNRVGSVFAHRMHEEAGASPADVVRAYVIVRETFGLTDFWKGVEALDNRVPATVQAALLVEAGRLMVRATLWFLRRSGLLVNIGATVAHFGAGVAALESALPGLLGEAQRSLLDREVEGLAGTGVPQPLALRRASFEPIFSALDIVATADDTGRPAALVAGVYFALGARFQFPWLRTHVGRLPSDTHWRARARAALRDELSALQRQLTTAVLDVEPSLDAAPQLIQAWESRVRGSAERARQIIAELQSVGTPDLAMLSVALRELRALA